MRTKDLKSLAETISTVVEPIDDRSKLIAEGYLNSLTEKARQVSENKDKNADDIMAKLAAKALKRARKKARRVRPSGDAAYAGINPPAAATDPDMKNRGAVAEAHPTSYEPKPMPKPKKPRFEPIPKPKPHLNEVAAPGYENWASDPKVKASFKKQYGKDWKQVMYGRSWNMAKGLAEAEQLDEIIHLLKKHKKKIGAALVGAAVGAGAGVAAPHVRDHMSSNPVRTSLTDKVGLASHKESPSFRAGVGAALGAGAMMVGVRRRRVNEAEQLDEAIVARAERMKKKSEKTGIKPKLDVEGRLAARRARIAAKHGMNAKFASSKPAMNVLTKALRDKAMKAKGLDPVGARYESVQLDEGKYRKLMRVKKAKYKAEQAARKMDPQTARQDIELNRLVNKHGKLGRAAAELEAQVAASMARRGGASDDAVRGGGSRIGKSGKYTKRAGQLANQRDKGIANFRNLKRDWGVSRDTGIGTVPAATRRLRGEKPQMTPAQVAKKRKDQAAMRDFRNRERSGDFGQNNQEGMRPRYNYLKRTGQLKTRRK